MKASGRELSYVLLVGTLLCYGVTFMLVVRPTDWVCGIQEFSIGLCFSIVYAALLTKTNRLLSDYRMRERERAGLCVYNIKLVSLCVCLLTIQGCSKARRICLY